MKRKRQEGVEYIVFYNEEQDFLIDIHPLEFIFKGITIDLNGDVHIKNNRFVFIGVL